MDACSDKGNGRFLTIEALAKAKRLPADSLKELGLHDLPAGGVGIPYFGPSGEPLFVRERESPRCNGKRFYQPFGVRLAAYGQWRICDAARAGFLNIVEGESDCWALWHNGLPAVGIPGAGAAKTLERELIEAVETIYIHREPDQGGEQFVARLRERLAALGYAGRLWELRLPNGVKDPADLHVADPEGFLAQFEAAVRAATPLGLPHVVERSKTLAPEASPPNNRFRMLEPFRPFPVEALASPIREYVDEASRALGCDPAYVALPALAVAASAIGNTRVIRLKRGWDEPSVVWAAIVGDSGTLKSPAYDKAVGHLFNVQRRLLAQYDEKVLRFKQELAEYKALRREAKEECERVGDSPIAPISVRVVCSDTTIEKLVEILGDNPRGTLVARDELAGWLTSFQRYKGRSGGTDLPNWLEMHRAGSVIVDRKSTDRKTLFVARAAVSIIGGIPPGVLARALTADFLDAGLAARFLMAMPPKLPKEWSEIEVAPEVEQGYEGALDRLLVLGFGRDQRGEHAPHVLSLSPEAKAIWIAFYNEWAQEQAGVEGEFASVYSKLEAYTARLSLLHHVVSCVGLDVDDRREVGARSIQAGISLCRWFAAESRRIYATLGESEEEHNIRRLLEFVQARGGCITVRELQRSNARKYPGADQAEAALNSLASAGCGDWLDRPTTERGGHPTRVLKLRPTHDTTDTTDTTDRRPTLARDTNDNAMPAPHRDFRALEGSVGSVMRQTQFNETPNDGSGTTGL
jgi:hypothetical protein